MGRKGAGRILHDDHDTIVKVADLDDDRTVGGENGACDDLAREQLNRSEDVAIPPAPQALSHEPACESRRLSASRKTDAISHATSLPTRWSPSPRALGRSELRSVR